MGSGKETKYFYGTVLQEEVDGLFGVEVGDASHYFKNMVRDANGQYCISYVDMNGKTIATSLAGRSPDATDALQSCVDAHSSSNTLTTNLLTAQNNIVVGRKIISTTTLIVPEINDYTFSYILNPESAEIIACNPQGQHFCYDCFYDLSITVSDNCGNYSKTFTATNVPPAPGSLDTDCNESTPVLSFPAIIFNGETNNFLTLPEGEYTVTKTLSLSQEAQDRYQEIYAQHNVCKTLEQFYNEIYQVILAGSTCALTCSQCNAALGTREQYRINYLNSIDPNLVSNPASVSAALENEIQVSYDRNRAACDELCGKAPGRLNDLKNLMIRDVSAPNGQYAKVDKKDEDYSIYKSVNGNPAPYLAPRNTDGVAEFYRDDYNNEDLTATNPPILDADDFNNRFKPSWAKSLLFYHPEYPKFKLASSGQLKISFEFDDALDNVNSYSDASAANLITHILDKDPFFSITDQSSSGVGSSYKNAMKYKMEENYLSVEVNGVIQEFSMWQIAWMSIHCLTPRFPNETVDEACALNAPKMPPFDVTSCSGDWNKVWTTFRSLYLTVKNEFVDQYLNENTPATQAFYNNPASAQYQRIFLTRSSAATQPISLSPNYLSTIDNPAPPGNPEDILQAEMNERFRRTCESYRAMWIEELRKCDKLNENMTPQEVDVLLGQLTDELKDICYRGSDVNHIAGSSSEIPGDAEDYDNFAQAIEHFFQQNGIPINTALCNPYLVTYPKPYESQSPISDYPMILQPDNCACEKLNTVIRNKQEDGYGGSLSAYMLYKYGIRIDQSTLDLLQSSCDIRNDNSEDCKTFDPVISLPGFFSCGAASETCISCNDYDRYLVQFHDAFPAYDDAPYSAPGSEEELEINLAFERFMNYKTGFSKNWTDYIIFKNACTSFTTTFECRYLQTIVDQFHLDHPGLTGQNCRDLFLAYFNQVTGQAYLWSDLETAFLESCGELPDVCYPVATCEQIDQIQIQFFEWYHNLPDPKPECQPAFVTYFNQHMGTAYADWDELDRFYSEHCDGRLTACEDYPCVVVIHVVKLYQATNPWIYADCIERFPAFFNNYFHTNLSDTEVFNIVYGCWDRVNICGAPVSCETLEQYVTHYSPLTHSGCTSVFQPGTAEYCRDCFTQYMNAALSFNFTYSQYETMYQTVCGRTLDVCEANFSCPELTGFVSEFINNYVGNNSMDCLTQFVESFNLFFNTSYSLTEIKSIYLLYCGYEPAVCNNHGRPGSTELLTIASNYKRLYPSAGTMFEDCESEFIKYYQLSTGVEMSFEELKNMYEEIVGYMPGVCSDSCTRIQKVYNIYMESFGTSQLPLQLRKDLLLELYSTEFGPENAISWDDLQRIFNSCGFYPDSTLDTQPFLTCSKVQGIKKAFYILNQGRLPDNCSEAFAGFFNFYYHVNWEFEHILSWGTSNCNMDLDFCNDLREGREFKLITERPVSVAVILPPRLCGLTNESPLDDTEPEDPCDDNITMANNASVEQYNLYLQSQINTFDLAYQSKCLQAKDLEQFKVTFKPAEYHYTLYYYDQAGNLVKTVPPAGVHPDYSNSYLESVKAFRKDESNPRPISPAHTLVTEYRYNTLNQVIIQSTPDAGISKFWYDKLGRLVLSQNAKQIIESKYSFTEYDELGRIKEVGEKSISGTVNQALTQNPTNLTAALSGTRYQVTHTAYDEAYNPLCPQLICQENLRNRVSYTYTAAVSGVGTPPWDAATFYSYDIHGNVKTLVQNYATGVMQQAGNAYKRIDYKYDLISGKVNEVAYQAGQPDAFYHRYNYDAENKLISVTASRDNFYWEQLASYNYYKHGPLARTVLGDAEKNLQVQGIDYAYTIQGWLKGVNSSAVDKEFDMGRDGKSGAGNSLVARDVFGFNLNYFEDDYIPINPAATTTAKPFINTILYNLNSGAVAAPLYNGNIASMLVNIPAVGSANLYGYKYDQLNRITKMDAFNGLANTTNSWATGSPTYSANYKERISYDANGNILTYLRNGTDQAPNPQAMDNLEYSYYSNSNKLKHVADAVASTNYSTDIDDQANAQNYVYDEIGNLIEDKAEGIVASGSTDGIEWNVYGKISAIHKTGTNITYTYDAAGNRISKNVNGKTTWYVRDASGNVMSVYEKGGTNNGGNLTQTELHLYGSSRLGILNTNTDVDGGLIPINEITTFTRGNKFFELSNHLGNVLVTITDKKLQHWTSGTTADYYEADVATANDYYPFGMMMPGRKFDGGGGYRYGFNGKEKDNEVKGEGNQQDYGMRVYDTRTCRFLSVDPITSDYPELTPYQFASNRPVDGIDMDGLEYTPAGRYGPNQIAVDATAVRHYTLSPLVADQQIKEVPDRQRVAIAAHNQMKLKSQASSAMTRYKEPDAIQKERNANLKKNHEAVTIPADSWTRNKYLNNFSERAVEPAATWAVGDGLGKVAFKGISLLLKAEAPAAYGIAYRAINPRWESSTIENGFHISGIPGRLGNDGVYANSTINGAIKEFMFHNPTVKPTIFEVKFPLGNSLSIDPPIQPKSYFAGPMPFTQGANILIAPSLRAPGTTNFLIRKGAQVGAKITTP